MSMPEACCPAAEPSRHNQPRELCSCACVKSEDCSQFRFCTEVRNPSHASIVSRSWPARLLANAFGVADFGSPATAARRVLKISRDTECGYRYISLFGRCLRLVSCATRALPHLRLRAFHRRSSLPSLCYPIAGNSVAAL